MIEFLFGLTLALAVAYGIIVAQMIALARIFRSRAWWLLASAFVLTGLRVLWNFIKLPSALVRAVQEGHLPAALTLEQWSLVGVAFVALGLFITGLDRLRRDLKRIGI